MSADIRERWAIAWRAVRSTHGTRPARAGWRRDVGWTSELRVPAFVRADISERAGAHARRRDDTVSEHLAETAAQTLQPWRQRGRPAPGVGLTQDDDEPPWVPNHHLRSMLRDHREGRARNASTAYSAICVAEARAARGSRIAALWAHVRARMGRTTEEACWTMMRALLAGPVVPTIADADLLLLLAQDVVIADRVANSSGHPVIVRVGVRRAMGRRLPGGATPARR